MLKVPQFIRCALAKGLEHIHRPKRSFSGSTLLLATSRAAALAIDEGSNMPRGMSSISTSTSTSFPRLFADPFVLFAIALLTANELFPPEFETGSLRLGGGSIPRSEDLIERADQPRGKGGMER